jgi:hypothetical protein
MGLGAKPLAEALGVELKDLHLPFPRQQLRIVLTRHTLVSVYFSGMPPKINFTPLEVVAISDMPVILAYPPDGGVQVKKAGIIGSGLTVKDVMDDWGKKFSKMIAIPKTAE